MELNIVDVGARYGLHPSFKEFENIANIILVDLDEEEVQRLKKKYKDNLNIEVLNVALGNKEENKIVNFTKHKGLITSYDFNMNFLKEYSYFEEESEIVQKREISFETIDKVFANSIDYLKLDVEGGELDVLKGSIKQLKENILAVRAEVNFHRVFQNQALFGDINNFLTQYDFELLNIDYNGQGLSMSKYTMPKRNGYLVDGDAVWVKKINSVSDDSKKLIKLILFLLTNHATDVAMRVLLQYKNVIKIDDSKMCKKMEELIETLFKNISYLPYIEQKELKGVFYDIFGTELKVMHHYYESKI